MNMRTFDFPEDREPERLDSFLAALLPELTRAGVQRLIEQGDVTVNERAVKASLKLKGGERIQLTIPPPLPSTAEPEEIPLTVLYEDSDLIVINKPAGMVVHPGAGNSTGTLVNALLAHCQDLSGIGGELRPGIVHRLDKDTSGILVSAKNDVAHQALAAQFKAHSTKRIYLALIFGSPKTDKGKIEGVIGRHPTERTKMSSKARRGKQAVTHWQVVARYGPLSLVRLRLETGRTHQIRVHLSEAGHPLVGDDVYGGAGRLPNLKDPQLRKLIKELGRQALHAKTLGFRHPTTGEYLEFDSELPPDMARLLTYLESTITPQS
jgi:23S rRNA pseudouridine1911/1915/1917 synthase